MLLNLTINFDNILYTTLLCGFFLLSYYIIIATRIEGFFKQGKTWQIRAFQIVIAVILAYLLAQAVFSLYNSIKF